MHGGGSVEAGGALVVGPASSLAVDDGGDLVGWAVWMPVCRVDAGEVREVGAARGPPSPLPVDVLDLAALPGRVRFADQQSMS